MNATSASSPHAPDAADPERPRRATASTITDPVLEALYDERDGLLRLLILLALAGSAA